MRQFWFTAAACACPTTLWGATLWQCCSTVGHSVQLTGLASTFQGIWVLWFCSLSCRQDGGGGVHAPGASGSTALYRHGLQARQSGGDQSPLPTGVMQPH